MTEKIHAWSDSVCWSFEGGEVKGKAYLLQCTNRVTWGVKSFKIDSLWDSSLNESTSVSRTGWRKWTNFTFTHIKLWPTAFTSLTQLQFIHLAFYFFLFSRVKRISPLRQLLNQYKYCKLSKLHFVMSYNCTINGHWTLSSLCLLFLDSSSSFLTKNIWKNKEEHLFSKSKWK